MKKLAILAIAFIVGCGTQSYFVGSTIIPATINEVEEGYEVNFWVHVTKDTRKYKLSIYAKGDSTWHFKDSKTFDVGTGERAEAEETIGYPHTVVVDQPITLRIEVRAIFPLGNGHANSATSTKIIEVP